MRCVFGRAFYLACNGTHHLKDHSLSLRSEYNITIKVFQYTGGHDLFSIGRRRGAAVSTADIPLSSQGAFFQHNDASEPEHWPGYKLVIRAIVKIQVFKRELLVENELQLYENRK